MTMPSLFDQPRARASDPETAHEAAAVVKPASSALIAAIRWTLQGGARLSAFDIAAAVEREHPGRWDEGTVRTAVSRAGLRAVDTGGTSPRGQRCCRYSL